MTHQKVAAVGGSLFNEINKKILWKNHNIKVKNISWVTSETVFDLIHTLIGQKTDCMVVHAGTDDIT